MSLPVIIIGSGGHGVVVADALLASGVRVLGFVDTDPARRGAMVCGVEVLGTELVLDEHRQGASRLANGIGGSGCGGTRRAVQERLEAQGWEFVTVRHPTAVVSPFAHLESSAQMLATSVVQANARIGKGCIVNTAAVIEHDVVLGDFVHVAPGAVLCGAVSVGPDSHVGAGAIVRQGICVGSATLIGAGAVLVSDSSGGATLTGVPAREVRS